MIQKRNLPHLWLEVKLFQTWVNTAFIAIFALFAYPFSVLVIVIQVVFVAIRPLHNPDGLSTCQWMRKVILCLIWLTVSLGVFGLLVFGTLIGEALKK